MNDNEKTSVENDVIDFYVNHPEAKVINAYITKQKVLKNNDIVSHFLSDCESYTEEDELLDSIFNRLNHERIAVSVWRKRTGFSIEGKAIEKMIAYLVDGELSMKRDVDNVMKEGVKELLSDKTRLSSVCWLALSDAKETLGEVKDKKVFNEFVNSRATCWLLKGFFALEHDDTAPTADPQAFPEETVVDTSLLPAVADFLDEQRRLAEENK
nr:MAG TPA: hypothetical protein [Caudoviricetes sp.]